MDTLVILFILFVILTIVAIVGHVIWVIVREFLKLLFGNPFKADQPPPSIVVPDSVNNGLKDLAATERQLVRFFTEGRLTQEAYEEILAQIREERSRLRPPPPRPVTRIPETRIPEPIVEPQSVQSVVKP